ncbi:neutral zinc metallopeptidase [Georgenia sp. TF02-10]|uniref:KPN_02809 family neutral zinc metallopeptidase n=1 Tax=Georgenia sp. TF02-10 TaxID=2917725 RepID=UPI001FA761B8|nr:neutral zinc metallopeptidase [Georgenia sp. TF02-10]UNX56051.1 neutral zinc metallopeptidase [Georgenia sp. TF02-10]
MSFTRGTSADAGREGVRRSRRRGGAAVGGGLGLVALVVYLFTGVDLSGVAGGQPVAPDTEDLGTCTAEEADTSVDCRMVLTAASLNDVWGAALPEQAQVAYTAPALQLFTEQVATGCGGATAAVGPFYCPPDQTVYLDTGFFDQLQSQLGAENAPLAQEYVVAHEYGHHVQNLLGTMASVDRQGTGPASGGVRLELQADCYAGLWVAAAASTPDPQTGRPLLVEPTRAEVQDALDAAAAVGDDRIQAGAGQQVTPETWTHGSAEQRMRWFAAGYEQGSVAACDTFAVDQP